MEEGKFLGYIVTSEGIRANSEKTKAVMDMPSPSSLKQMQRLNGKLAALNRFLSKAAKMVLPCLDTLKKCANKKDFHWTAAAKEAFQTMNKLIAELPTLTDPMKDEELMVYLSATNEAVSVVLLAERKGRQVPIHYVSRVLQGAKINYPPMEKLTLALVHAARQFRRYFQGHTIKVITDKPINQILSNQEATGRLAKWAIELKAYGIQYAPRNAIKRQVLADFLADTMTEDSPAHTRVAEQEETLTEGKMQKVRKTTEDQVPTAPPDETNLRKLYTDEASNDHGSGAGIAGWSKDNSQADGRKDLRIRKFKDGSKLGPQQAKYVIKEIHTRSCGMHDEPRKAHKAMNAEYYWLSMHRDANNEITSCDSCQGIKKRLLQEEGAWIEELPNVLWAHRTTPKTSNREIPFSLAYSTKAVIHAEIGIPTRRIIQGLDEENEEALQLNLNLLQER
ncbi:reverse transcriptase domain-containing protein [Tanacetum coccineum]|uniref:Reverse transcriptase domain-containing protein n=1 Tax=Tanacetum coccineum TaxID=301880 RepID=A0ABQ5IDQ4_9ASTR